MRKLSPNEQAKKNSDTAALEGFVCDGYCYGCDNHSICGAIDICPVTRKSEALATIIVLLIAFLVFAVMIVAGLSVAFKLIYGLINNVL